MRLLLLLLIVDAALSATLQAMPTMVGIPPQGSLLIYVNAPPYAIMQYSFCGLFFGCLPQWVTGGGYYFLQAGENAGLTSLSVTATSQITGSITTLTVPIYIAAIPYQTFSVHNIEIFGSGCSHQTNAYNPVPPMTAGFNFSTPAQDFDGSDSSDGYWCWSYDGANSGEDGWSGQYSGNYGDAGSLNPSNLPSATTSLYINFEENYSCSGDYYNAGGQCVPCQFGPGAVGAVATDCSPFCEPGYTIDPSLQYCDQCSSGTYKTSLGNIACTPCADGYTSNPGATSCFVQCQPGSYLCEECGYYFGGDGYFCEECYPGSYQPNYGANSCFDCPDGQVSSFGATSCFNDPCTYPYYFDGYGCEYYYYDGDFKQSVNSTRANKAKRTRHRLHLPARKEK